MSQQTRCFGLLKRRAVWVPSLRGLLVIAAFVVLAGALVVFRLHGFLARNSPVDACSLVIEGWLPDYGLRDVIGRMESGRYDKVFVVGGPIEKGALLSGFETYAEASAATLVRMGLSESVVQPVPAPEVTKDRTYASALALRRWLDEHAFACTNFNLVSLGPHARRSHFLFEKAFADRRRIGVVAMEDQDYDPDKWWRSSKGVRTVIGESIAYVYVRLFF